MIMNAKTIAIVSYITIIGWLIAYFQHKNSKKKSALASSHAIQSLGAFIFGKYSYVDRFSTLDIACFPNFSHQKRRSEACSADRDLFEEKFNFLTKNKKSSKIYYFLLK